MEIVELAVVSLRNHSVDDIKAFFDTAFVGGAKCRLLGTADKTVFADDHLYFQMFNRGPVNYRREYEDVIREGGFHVIVATKNVVVVLTNHEDACVLEGQGYRRLEDLERAVEVLFPEHKDYLLSRMRGEEERQADLLCMDEEDARP